MKKRIALILALLLVVSLLAACGITKEEAVGTWTASWDYNGNHYDGTMTILENGTYKSLTVKNGSSTSTEKGTYEIDGGKLVLHPDGDQGSRIVFKFSGGKLKNGASAFVKTN